MDKILTSVSLVSVEIPNEIVTFCECNNLDLYDFCCCLLYPNLKSHLYGNFISVSNLCKRNTILSDSILKAFRK